MFGFVYLIYSTKTFEIQEAFANQDECITIFNHFYGRDNSYDWIALNMARYTDFVKRYNETK